MMTLAWARERNYSTLRHSSRNLPLKLWQRHTAKAYRDRSTRSQCHGPPVPSAPLIGGQRRKRDVARTPRCRLKANPGCTHPPCPTTPFCFAPPKRALADLRSPRLITGRERYPARRLPSSTRSRHYCASRAQAAHPQPGFARSGPRSAFPTIGSRADEKGPPAVTPRNGTRSGPLRRVTSREPFGEQWDTTEEAGGRTGPGDRGDEGDRRKKMVGVPARREQVAYAMRRGLSQRRSCTPLGVARSARGYQSMQAEKDAPVLERMAALGAQYPRFGYRRIGIFLDREGHGMTFGRCYRLWRCARLQVPRRQPRKRIASDRPRPLAPTGRVCSYDFVGAPTASSSSA